MNATNRRLAIFDKLISEKKVVVMELAAEFNVTPMTIRRDLSVLENRVLSPLTMAVQVSMKGLPVNRHSYSRTRTRLMKRWRLPMRQASLLMKEIQFTLIQEQHVITSDVS